MTDKENVSTKLRRWANEGDRQNRNPSCIAEKELGTGCYEISCMECNRRILRKIADMVDEEERGIQEQALGARTPYGRRHLLERHFAIVARTELGKPFEYGESITKWLDRWYVPRPLFEDGEPVQFGDQCDYEFCGQPSILPVECIAYTNDGVFELHDRTRIKPIVLEYGERVTRYHAPVLDADGVEIREGDTVYLLPGEHCDSYPLCGYHRGDEYRVVVNENIKHKEEGRIAINNGAKMSNGYALPEQLTHTPPDTQERIDEDALKLVNGISEQHQTDTIWCSPLVTALDEIHDLLRRQRELDARTMGGAR